MTSGQFTSFPTDQLHVRFNYDRLTGKLYWRWHDKKSLVGKEAGTLEHRKGVTYRRVHLLGRRYYTHQIVWAMLTGSWPVKVIDHFDGDGLNNRPDNLQEVTQSINLLKANRTKTSSSGITYVYKTALGKFYIKKFGKYLGTYDSLNEAEKRLELAS